MDFFFLLSFAFFPFFLLDFFFLGHKKSTVRSFFSVNGTRKLDNMVALDMVLPFKEGVWGLSGDGIIFPSFSSKHDRLVNE